MLKNGASNAWSMVKHGKTDLVKLGAKAVGKAVPVIYYKAKHVAKKLYNDAKHLAHIE